MWTRTRVLSWTSPSSVSASLESAERAAATEGPYAIANVLGSGDAMLMHVGFCAHRRQEHCHQTPSAANAAVRHGKRRAARRTQDKHGVFVLLCPSSEMDCTRSRQASTICQLRCMPQIMTTQGIVVWPRTVPWGVTAEQRAMHFCTRTLLSRRHGATSDRLVPCRRVWQSLQGPSQWGAGGGGKNAHPRLRRGDFCRNAPPLTKPSRCLDGILEARNATPSPVDSQCPPSPNLCRFLLHIHEGSLR